MRTVWAMLAALLISIIILDLGKVYLTYNKIYTVLEHTLDAAITAGIQEDDARRGQAHIQTDLARTAAETVFRESLSLDNAMENNLMKKTNLRIEITPDALGKRPSIQGTVSTTVTAMSPRLFGLEGYQISINKTLFHVSDFK